MLKTTMLTFITVMMHILSLSAALSDGEALERQMWADIKAHKWNAVESHIAADFQSIHSDGFRDRTREVDLLKRLNLGNYILSDFVVTETPGTFTVSYMVAADETIDEEHLPPKPTPRLSVWQKINGNWQWIVHANLNPMK